MTDVGRIAERLTEPQKRRILLGEDGLADAKTWREVGRPLKDRGLIRFEDDPRSSRTLLTSLGRAVRKHLQELDEGGRP